MVNSKTLKEAGIFNKTELSLMFKMSNIKQTENPFKRNIEDEAVNTIAFDEGPFFMLTHFWPISYLSLTPNLEALPREAIQVLILCETFFMISCMIFRYYPKIHIYSQILDPKIISFLKAGCHFIHRDHFYFYSWAIHKIWFFKILKRSRRSRKHLIKYFARDVFENKFFFSWQRMVSRIFWFQLKLFKWDSDY